MVWERREKEDHSIKDITLDEVKLHDNGHEFPEQVNTTQVEEMLEIEVESMVKTISLHDDKRTQAFLLI